MDKNEKKVKLFKIGHLFTGGYGSFTFAVKKIGIDYINEFGCELMAPQIECYDKNHGSPKKWFVDITKTDFSEYFGKIDMLQGSPVCKSYSMAGQREGLDSSDGMLMDETIRAIAEIQPETFIIENSASLTSVNGGADWDLILKQFNKLEGYTISWGKMNEKDYGIPQNRNRLFIIGFRAKISQFNFPHKQKLKLALIDLLEQHVPKKYFLSMKMLNGFKAHKERHDGKGNGFGMKLTDPNGICGAVSTKCGNRQTDPFIDRLDLVKLGNIAASGHDSLLGRVYDPKGIACNQNASGLYQD
jgi:DNA (cytosine-5)-methyltransferase 1